MVRSLLLFLLFGFFHPATAQESIVLTPIKDNTLFEDTSGALSNGAGQFLFAGKTRDFLRRALIAFDFEEAGITSASLDSVRLTITVSRSISASLPATLHRVTANWGEGTSNAEANEGKGIASTTDDATWIHSFFDTAMWSSAGGDFEADPSATLNIAGNGMYSVTSTGGLLADVKSWIDNPAENYGWILLGDEGTNQSAKRFNSREHSDAATHPTLELFTSTSPSSTEGAEIAGVPRVLSNYPNPFREHTVLTFSTPYPALVQVKVYNILGREVLSTAPVQVLGNSVQRIEIDGASLAPGIYAYRLNLTGPRDREVLTGIVTRVN